MTTYLIRRTLQGIMVLFFASALIYLILNSSASPLEFVNQIPFKDKAQKEARVQQIKRQYGLINADGSERNILVRYFYWLYSPEPDNDDDPYFLQNEIAAADRQLSTCKTNGSSGPACEAAQESKQVATSKLTRAQENLTACSNLFSGDNFGKCTSINRIGGILTGNWGVSIRVSSSTPVLDVLFGKPGERLRSNFSNTMVLLTLALLISLLIALPIGIYSAVKQYSIADYAVTTFSFFGLSMPTFWFGLMLILFFSLTLGWLPTGDVVDNVADVNQYGNIGIRLQHIIMPLMVLTITSVAGWSRFLRASMLEVLRQDYVRTAWAKGLRQRTVILKHALRNALIPLVTLMALAIPGLFGGAIITERIFNYQGMGTLYFKAIGGPDWSVAMAFLLISSFLVVIANILADIAYAFVDPRIRY